MNLTHPSLTLTSLAIGFYLIHGGYHLARKAAFDLLWICNFSALLVPIGIAAGLPGLTGAGVLWLSVGLPAWLTDVAMGARIIPTSVLTHVGTPIVGFIALLPAGLPGGTWWRSWLIGLMLHLLSRRVTPAHANVNVAFAVWPGWDKMFTSHTRYVATLMAGFAVALFASEVGLRFLVQAH